MATNTGTPGAPDATTSIDGNYLPPAPPRFGGEIGLDAKESKPFWPARVVPPKGAPNILLIMSDDQGYGVSSTVRRCHPDADARPDRKGGASVYALPLHLALLALAGGTADRTQPSQRGIWCPCRAVRRLSRL